jgi:hypothetical protein
MHTQAFTHIQLAFLKHSPLWSWNLEFTFHLQKCTETNCLRSLADLPPSGQFTRLGLFGQELLVYTSSAKPRSVSSTKCNRDTLTTLCLTRNLCVANLKVQKSTRTSNVQTAELHPPSITPNTSNRTLVSSLSLSPSDHASWCQLQLLGWPPAQRKNQQPTQDAVHQPISLLPAHFLSSYPTVRANPLLAILPNKSSWLSP